jgi:predicted membrane protein (TIGR00267 family)
MLTMLTASLALGISTGVSVYEAESLERERRLEQLEGAMLTDLSGTRVEESGKEVIILATAINFSTPILAYAVTASPFALVYMGVIGKDVAAGASVIAALGILFGAGLYLGKLGKQNPWMKAIRMVGFGVLAFAIGLTLEYFIIGR